MRLKRLEIANFRGIRHMDWRHIGDTVALVGPGDSCKTTVLDAIERVLSPRWSVTFDDTDFWMLATGTPIVIRATVADLPADFYRETKFGLVLHEFDEASGTAIEASGGEDKDYALVVELRVASDLEPTWSVLDSSGTRHPISARDREALGVLRVGGYLDHHLCWSRGSVLTRLTEAGDSVASVLAGAARNAREGAGVGDLGHLQSAAKKVEAIAKNVGVAPQTGLVANLDAESLSVHAGALSLHDGSVPVRRSGFGTRRLLAIAMQRAVGAQHGLALIDELENGLEPHRIRRLLRVLRGKKPENGPGVGGQTILTTHSGTVLSELEPSEIFVARKDAKSGVVVQCLPGPVNFILKRTPEALLARRVLVVEGLTEQGICDALDEEWESRTGASFGYRGTSVIDGGGGTQPAIIAGNLHSMGYAVALLVDSDAKAKMSNAKGALVLSWPGGVCTEQRLALDLPESAVRRMTKDAALRATKGQRSVHDAMACALKVPRDVLGDDPESWADEVAGREFRVALGNQAKSHGWFKSRDGGAFLGKLVCEHEDEMKSTPTMSIVNAVREFVHNA